jgi:diketogulonate reductase-like aldo/keto reductase
VQTNQLLYKTASQAALAWLLRRDDVIVIPKCGRREHLRENLGALEIRLTQEQLAELDRLFPPPRGPQPLAML